MGYHWVRQMVEVFVLSGNEYTLQAQFRPGQKIQSVLLPDLEMDVNAIFGTGEV